MKNVTKLHMTFLLIIFAFCITYGQTRANESKYLVNTAKADSFFSLKDYQKAVTIYEKAFEENNGLGKVGHRYKAASCFALLNIPDSAFFELDKIVKKGKFSHYEMIINDFSFESLYSDPRWNVILKAIEENKKNKPNIIPDN